MRIDCTFTCVDRIRSQIADRPNDLLVVNLVTASKSPIFWIVELSVFAACFYRKISYSRALDDSGPAILGAQLM